MFISRYLVSRLALFSLLGVAVAVPAPVADPAPDKTVDLAPRSCQTQIPTAMDVMYRDYPDTPYVGNVFLIQRLGSQGMNTIKTTFTFDGIPPGATGCMLAIEFPSVDFDNQYGAGPSVTVDIWSTRPWTRANPPTYNHQPVKDQMVGTINIPIKQTPTPFRTIVASNVCSPTMSWMAEYSPWQQKDGVARWVNELGRIGFSLVYNC